MVYLQVWMASVFISFQRIQFRAAKARSTRLEDRVLKRLLLKGESICAGSWWRAWGCGNVFVASPWACTTAGWWMPSVLRHIVILEQRRICKKRIKRLKSYVGYLLCNTYLGCRARKQRFRVTRFLKLDSPPHYLYLIINILLLLIQISRWELSSHLVFILARIHQKPPKCSLLSVFIFA